MAYPGDQEHFLAYSNQNIFGNYVSDGSIGTEDSNFWSSSPRSDSPSPNPYYHNNLSSFPLYKPLNYSTDISSYKNGYSTISLENNTTEIPFVRVVKRRTTANKKERRRTMSINNAYADLRDCIPNVPQDTKLSKIKTLRLATSYISYLTRALESDNPTVGFKAELGTISRRPSNTHTSENSADRTTKKEMPEELNNQRKAKGRTGWPQHVWALELKQEQTL